MATAQQDNPSSKTFPNEDKYDGKGLSNVDESRIPPGYDNNIPYSRKGRRRRMLNSSEGTLGSGETLGSDAIPDTKKEVVAVHRFAARDSRAVCLWKYLVLVMLAIAGVLLSIFAYTFLSNANENSIVIFTDIAQTMTKATTDYSEGVLTAVESMANTIAATAESSSTQFPEFTLTVFDVEASHVLAITGAELLTYSPIVQQSQRASWESYTQRNAGHWLQQTLMVRRSRHTKRSRQAKEHISPVTATSEILQKQKLQSLVSPSIYDSADIVTGKTIEAANASQYLPMWQYSPVIVNSDTARFINYNMISDSSIQAQFESIKLERETVFSPVRQFPFLLSNSDSSPRSLLMQPIMSVWQDNSTPQGVVGVLAAIVPWTVYLQTVMSAFVESTSSHGSESNYRMYALLENTCRQQFTYHLSNEGVEYVGPGDLRNTASKTAESQAMKVTIPLTTTETTPTSDTNATDQCDYSLVLFPSHQFQYRVATANIMAPTVAAVIVAVLFVVMIANFCIYDRIVRSRNTKVVDAAARSNAIVSSLFPSQIRDRLFASAASASNSKENDLERDDSPDNTRSGPSSSKTRLKDFLNDKNTARLQQVVEDTQDNTISGDSEVLFEGKPIADLFTETTVIFADIAGFTAWSSVREPSQVFTLLETIYRAFDEIAKTRRVFKVETVGDCYVAVTGLPDPLPNHAVAMARFASDCMRRMNSLTKKLELTLGPDTGDLTMRMGLHSGPVTAGVLRGERSRFQLFGDTMNTASRMESTGLRGKIQVSQETADLLTAAGKWTWISPRSETVHAKGKGEMQTYWLLPQVMDACTEPPPPSQCGSIESFGANMTMACSSDGMSSIDSLLSSESADTDTPLLTVSAPRRRRRSKRERSIRHLNKIKRSRDHSAATFGEFSSSQQSFKDLTVDNDITLAASHIPSIYSKKVYELSSEKKARLIDWNVDVLVRVLKQIVARRKAMAKWMSVSEFLPISSKPAQALSNLPGADLVKSGAGIVAKGSADLVRSGADIVVKGSAMAVKGSVATVKTGADLLKSATNTNNRKPSQTIPGCPPASTVLGEVKEIITMPKFNIKAAKYQEDPESIHLDAAVEEQLHDYVSNIAALYHGNSFHNFEHASHVAMSVVKLLSRIVAPIDIDGAHNDKKGKQTMASNLHDHTYGITSDPLTQFACIISALIHDVDHPGVPNAQLVKENSHLAQVYNGKSVAEQNSVDLAWALLMDKRYGKLRATIFQTDAELKRFRQLVVNSVMATDIIDKDLKQLRNARWDAAFSEAASQEESSDDSNRKATIVIEHLIQASDVAHTMQHWHIYRKWNERFFLECFISYREGRAKDPTTYWYEGELGFFDFYIIPLAKKLKDCGVFGVSSDEYLNYAVRNRDEWEFRGKEIVAEMVELANRKLDIDVPPEVPVVSAL